MLVLVWMVKWKSFAFVQLKYCDHLALLTCKSINIRIPNIISTGHDLETCCYDRYRGSNFKPVGSFCKEVWLSSIDRGWEHKVCINLSSNYWASMFCTKLNCVVGGSACWHWNPRFLIFFLTNAIIAESNLYMLLMSLLHLLQPWRMTAIAWERFMNWVVLRSLLCMNW